MSCHNYIFFDREPSFALLSKEKTKKYKAKFSALLGRTKNVEVSAYATLGLRASTRFMLHLKAEEADTLQQLVQTLMHTELGAYLHIRYTLLGLTRSSQYHSNRTLEEKEFKDGIRKYLIVYPFTKTIEWHLLPFEERRAMMKEHVTLARTFSDSIEQLLLYAYGIDDHEFIVSYQTDSLETFQTLVMELRGTRGRAYTKNDTPIFTGIYRTIEEALETL